MDIVHGADLDWSEGEEKHREGRLSFKTLFKGTPDTPENYRLVLTRNNGPYKSPRHHHNFDQVRFCLEGQLNIAPRVDIAAGDAGYFPEGAFYGPQDDGDTKRLSLTLQFGGASGGGFMNSEQMKVGHAELAKRGKFEGGAYHHGDSRRKQDAYEAIWEHVSGRPMVYPPPRYPGPILFKTANFSWWPMGAGAHHKLLGTFTERATLLEIVRLEADASITLGAPTAELLVFVLNGAGSCAGTRLKQYSAVRLKPGETAAIRGQDMLEAFVITLPLLTPLKEASVSNRQASSVASASPQELAVPSH
jgi:hypothetical protein